MVMTKHSPNGTRKGFLPGILRTGILMVFFSVCLCIAARQAEAQAKARRPSRYACPVTENLFPKQERSGNVLRYIFPDITNLALRMSVALVSSDGKDIEIAFRWTDWGLHPGSLIVKADGSPNCYFLGPSREYHEDISFVEISLTIPPGVEVKGVAFSSLRSEYVSRDCPMPELEKEILKAYEESRLSPQDEAKTARFIALMEKAVPEYDCVQGSGYDPVPAWCIIGEGNEGNLNTILDLIQYLYQKVKDANESALRVFAGMFNKADGMIGEVMADQIWKVLHDKPVFILKVWPDIRGYRRNIVLCSVGLQDPASVPGMIEIYRDIAIKEPKYKSACNEIISILSENKPNLPQTTSVDAVKKLTAEIDQYVKANQDSDQKLVARRGPLDHSSPGDSWHWKRIENWDEADEYFNGYWGSRTVAVWTIDSNVAFVKTSEWSDSGDWAIYINYYFDDRGRLLHISTDFRTLIDDLKTLDFQYFDESGQILDHTVDYYAIGDNMAQKLPAKPEIMEQPMQEIPVYLKASDLPFYGLIHLDRKTIGPVKFGTSKSTARERMCN